MRFRWSQFLNQLDSRNKCNWVKINKLFFQKKGLKSPSL